MKINYKNTIFIAMLLLAFNVSFSQNADSVKKYKNTVAINFSDPILKAISKNKADTSAITIVAPIISYQRRIRKSYFKIGVSGTNYINKTSNELYSDKTTDIILKVRTIIGWYRQTEIAKKISFQYGINATGVYYHNNQVFDSGFDQVNIYDKSIGTGLGPGVALYYKINKRLSLSTEYMLIYQANFSQKGKKFSAFPEENYSTLKTNTFGFQFDYPIAIYLNYHF